MANPPVIRRPSVGLLLLEGRALFELGAAALAYPVLKRAPRGDGHPVLVLPGFMAGDFSTRVLRGFLRDRGYGAHGWKLGRNDGPSPELVAKLGERFAELFQRYARRMSLIGWSLGGIYARELARRFPEGVRQVITLGSPFRDVDATNVPAVLRQRAPRPEDAALTEQLRQPIPVPMTSIYSRTDGIAPWQSCVSDPGDTAENIEVESSHLGIGHNPVVLLTIADRLAQPEGAWQKFKAPPGWRWPLVPRVADW
ncbi:alpha/beta hydrolase [Candidatus Binatia bacterium]|nr:alpha/beta hydrolase [Candidatus Binatia bacterium]